MLRSCKVHNLICTAFIKGAYRNGASVYISMYGVMECSTSENVTPVPYKRDLILACMGFVYFVV